MQIDNTNVAICEHCGTKMIVGKDINNVIIDENNSPSSMFDDTETILKMLSFKKIATTIIQSPSKFSLSCSKANGVKRIKNITILENPVFDVKLRIHAGRFAVALVKDNIVHIICNTDVDFPIKTNLQAGKYNLRIFAEDAKVDFLFKFNDYK
jgi:uncharacterized protein (DUF2141 family)